MHGWLTLVWTLCVWFFAEPAQAEPTVRVRGESRIEIGVTHTALGVAISGALRDELGTALGGRRLSVEAIPESAPHDPWAAELTTDDTGRFTLEITDHDRNYRLLATFAGDAGHRGVRVERNVERARDDVRLELKLGDGPRIDLDRETVAVDVVAESDAGGDGLAMRLTDEAGRELAQGMTRSDGRLRLLVPTEQLGAPGAGLLRIESLRDDRRAEAQTEARVVRTRAVQLTLVPELDTFEAGSPIVLTGSARTRIGPRAHVPIGLYAGDQHLETLLTDARGQFSATLWPRVREGHLVLSARSDGDVGSAYPAAETSVTLLVTPPRPLPLPWLVGATLLVLVGLPLIARARAKLSGDSVRPPPAEIQQAKRVLPRKPQGKRDRHRINGRVHDLRNDAPVPFAKISLVHEQPDGSCVLAADDAGRFASPVLPAGRLRMRVESPGFVTTELDLDVPHRGEWTSFGVRLESLRERALVPFRRLALRVLPSARSWGVWTTREVREWITRAAPTRRAQLGDLTLEVERACYDEQPPSEAEVWAIEDSVRTVESGLGLQNDPPSAPESRAAR